MRLSAALPGGTQTAHGLTFGLRCLQTAILILGLNACSTTTYLHTTGAGVQQGSGGSYRVVEGIDFYGEGSPNRSYEVIGVITDSRPAGPWTLGPRARTIARLAAENGGNAVIQQSDVRELAGFSTAQNSNWNESGSSNGTDENGRSYAHGIASGNSTTVALYNAHARLLVVRYR
jgi:hypothetical protein